MATTPIARSRDRLGASETVTRTVTVNEFEALSLAAATSSRFTPGAPIARSARARDAGAAAAAILAGAQSPVARPGARSSPRSCIRRRDPRGHTLTALSPPRQARRRATHRFRLPLHQPARRRPRRGLVTSARTPAASRTQSRHPPIVLRHNDGFVPLFAACAELPAVVCAVVHPCRPRSLQGAVGAAAQISSNPCCRSRGEDPRRGATEGIDIAPFDVAVEHSHAAAAKASSSRVPARPTR